MIEADEPIRLVLSDVDGTLITGSRDLTPATIDAVQRLGEAGILFAVTSGRPPRGVSMFVEPLAISTPIAAFNGGVFVDRDLTVLEQHTIPRAVVGQVLQLLDSRDMDAWLYRGAEWLIRNADAPHVDREAATVGFGPTVVTDYHDLDALAAGAVKIVGISDDHDKVASVEAEAQSLFGDHVSAARSQPYYLDITHPNANKGNVARYLATRYEIPAAAIATMGDMPNDVLMFAHSGLSIAMGNASSQVKRAARRVTTSNDNEGFTAAVDRYILPRRPN